MKKEMFDIRCERNIRTNHIEMHMFQNGAVAKPIVMETPVEEGYYTEPFTCLSPEDAQLLIDELWRCGLRPTEGTGSAGSLAATQAHLKDMKAIAFSRLKIDLV